MTRLSLFLAALLIVAAGCEPRPPADVAPPEEPRAENDRPNAEPEGQECTNPEAGYTVVYPADWRANDGEIIPPCSLFDPDDVAVEPDTETPADIAVVIRVEDTPFETLAGEMLGERQLARENTTVDGRRAARVETEATGEGLYPEGMRTTRYVVDLDGRSLVAESHDVGEPEYAEKQRRLEAMIASLRFEAG